jgi:hypothetical protein
VSCFVVFVGFMRCFGGHIRCNAVETGVGLLIVTKLMSVVWTRARPRNLLPCRAVPPYPTPRLKLNFNINALSIPPSTYTRLIYSVFV